MREYAYLMKGRGSVRERAYLMKGRGSVLVPGEGQALAGEELRHHGHNAGGGGIVQDADRVLQQARFSLKGQCRETVSSPQTLT